MICGCGPKAVFIAPRLASFQDAAVVLKTTTDTACEDVASLEDASLDVLVN